MIPHVAISEKDGILILTENGKDMVIHCTIEEYYRGVKLSNEGELIQYAFPTLSVEEREFMQTGLTPEEQKKIFGW